MPRVSFSKPPVIEVVLGVEFPRIAAWRIVHYGLLWQAVRERFPKFEVMSALAPSPPMGLSFTFQTASDPAVRMWLVSEDGSRVLQVQPDRIIYNWRKLSNESAYPSYDKLKPEFIDAWNIFQEFLSSNGLPGIPAVLQCEVTYVNAIARGEGWDSFSGLSKVFPYISGKTSSSFLPPPQVIQVNAHYLLAGDVGLNISMQPALRSYDQAQILQLNLSARNPAQNGPDFIEWMDAAHEAIVRSFVDFTSAAMQKRWGMRNE